MFEERNIFMSNKFMDLLHKLNMIYYEDNTVTTSIEMGKEITGKLDQILFYPPNFVSELDCIYCDVEGYQNNNLKKFYDFEYLYDVEKTYRMNSKCHKNFKHNVNIFSNRLDSKYRSDFSFADGDFKDIMNIREEWLSTDVSYEFNDSLMIKLILNHTKEFEKFDRKIMYLEGEPVSFVLYDKSPSYIHLFTVYGVPTIEYIEDYTAWMFFRYLYQKKEKKAVNFGGVYSDNNIKKFKDRLCPYEVRDRWSWFG